MTQLKYYNGTTWVTAVVGAQGSTGSQGSQGYQGSQGVTYTSPYTAAGQIEYGTGSGSQGLLNVGSAGQILTVNSGATGPQWNNTLPAAVSASKTWTATTGVTTAITGYNTYIVLAEATVSLSTAAAIAFYVNWSASSGMTSPTQIGAIAEWIPVSGAHNYGIKTFAIYAPGSSSTFYMQIGSSSSIAGGSLIVIGIN
jgi:hypothetical protein